MRVYYNSITLVYHTRVTKRAGHRPGPGQGPASNRPGSWAVPARGREGSGTFPERVREGSGHESDPESGLRPSLAADVRPVVWPPAGRAASAASVRLGSPPIRSPASGLPWRRTSGPWCGRRPVARKRPLPSGWVLLLSPGVRWFRAPPIYPAKT